jgi:hypothetical protein
VQALLYGVRQLKLRQISRDLDFDPNGRRHVTLTSDLSVVSQCRDRS